MSENGEIQSIENAILTAIEIIEKKMKKRTDLGRICKLVISDKNGLSTDDIENAVSQMHKDERLKLKRYNEGPASYKINKDHEIMETYSGIGKEYDNETVKDSTADDNNHTMQDSFLDFLDDVSTPEKTSTYGDRAQKSGCRGLEYHSPRIMHEDPSIAPSQGFSQAINYGNLVEVIGKMADTLNRHAEMLRDEKSLNAMLRDTIDTLKGEVLEKSLRIKELEESVRQALGKDQQALEPPEGRQMQALNHPESQRSKEPEPTPTPSFDAQLGAYIQSKREKYEELLVKRKADEMHSLNKLQQQKPEQASMQKRNKRIKQKSSLAPQVQMADIKDQNKHAPASAAKGKQTSSFTWKKGTVLITGDSMLNNIDESKLQMKCDVKVRPFSGATTEDMHSYLKPLLKKGPTTVFLHIGTNDATANGIDSDSLVKRILHLKEEIEKSVDGCKVILSLPIRRRDNIKANEILSEVCDKIMALKLDLINNNNIMHEQLGRRGLHLNQHGNARFALNLINKLRYV